MTAGGPDKDSTGKTLATHSGTGFAQPSGESPTAGPYNNYPQAPRLNRAERRALARKKK